MRESMSQDQPEDYATLASRIAYRNAWMTIREDRFRRPNGDEGLYGVVERPDFVVVVPIHADGSIELVEQYRYPVRRRLWELPMGTWKDGKGDPAEAARGELREETGLVAGRWTHLGRLVQAPGMATPCFDLFVAQELSRGPAQPEADELELVSRAFPASQLLDMIRDGTFIDATSLGVLAVLMARGLFPAPPDRGLFPAPLGR
jgi:ADP-ribose pyrophosphatase